MVLTPDDRLGPSGVPAGYEKAELAVPHRRFRAGGLGVDVASFSGGRPPADPDSASPYSASFDVTGPELDAAVGAHR